MSNISRNSSLQYFLSIESLEQLETVRIWLTINQKKYMQNDPPSRETLSQLIVQFIQYQETKLGKNAVDPVTTRIPMRCFMDFKPGGALCIIFSIMYRFKFEQCWERFDIEFGNHKVIFRMIFSIEAALCQANCIVFPVVFVRPEVDKKLSDKIKKVVMTYEGEFTQDEEKATHIVYGIVEPSPEEYARPSFKRGNYVMLHWYYFPESYDSWVSASSFDMPDNVPDCPGSPGEKWRVSANWILDLDQYNEWMAEEDYEVDEQGRKKVHKLRLTVEDLMSLPLDEEITGQPNTTTKRKRTEFSSITLPKKVGQKRPCTEDEESESSNKNLSSVNALLEVETIPFLQNITDFEPDTEAPENTLENDEKDVQGDYFAPAPEFSSHLNSKNGKSVKKHNKKRTRKPKKVAKNIPQKENVKNKLQRNFLMTKEFKSENKNVRNMDICEQAIKYLGSCDLPQIVFYLEKNKDFDFENYSKYSVNRSISTALHGLNDQSRATFRNNKWTLDIHSKIITTQERFEITQIFKMEDDIIKMKQVRRGNRKLTSQAYIENGNFDVIAINGDVMSEENEQRKSNEIEEVPFFPETSTTPELQFMESLNPSKSDFAIETSRISPKTVCAFEKIDVTINQLNVESPEKITIYENILFFDPGHDLIVTGEASFQEKSSSEDMVDDVVPVVPDLIVNSAASFQEKSSFEDMVDDVVIVPVVPDLIVISAASIQGKSSFEEMIVPTEQIDVMSEREEDQDNDVPPRHQTFKKMGVHDSILKSIKKFKFAAPYDIQKELIPAIEARLDVHCTGPENSGKTVGLLIGVLNLLMTREFKEILGTPVCIIITNPQNLIYILKCLFNFNLRAKIQVYAKQTVLNCKILLCLADEFDKIMTERIVHLNQVKILIFDSVDLASERKLMFLNYNPQKIIISSKKLSNEDFASFSKKGCLITVKDNKIRSMYSNFWKKFDLAFIQLEKSKYWPCRILKIMQHIVNVSLFGQKKELRTVHINQLILYKEILPHLSVENLSTDHKYAINELKIYSRKRFSFNPHDSISVYTASESDISELQFEDEDDINEYFEDDSFTNGSELQKQTAVVLEILTKNDYSRDDLDCSLNKLLLTVQNVDCNILLNNPVLLQLTETLWKNNISAQKTIVICEELMEKFQNPSSIENMFNWYKEKLKERSISCL